jgi:hypothetical protein
MLTGVIIIALVSLLAVFSHRRTRFEKRIYKNVPLSDWILILVVPILIYIGWVMVVENILSRPNFPIFPMGDFDILAITILFMVYGFVGNALHFISKVLWRYLRKQKNSMAYRINEMFHGRLSHYLAYLNGTFILFLLMILEINHPLPEAISLGVKIVIVMAGIMIGYSCVRAIFLTNQWFGGDNKPIFFLVLGLSWVEISIIKLFNLDFDYYPISWLVTVGFMATVVTFLVRQFLIFSRLNSKRRLRYLSRIFSAQVSF